MADCSLAIWLPLHRAAVISTLVLTSAVPAVRAHTPTCDGLAAEPKRVADGVMASQFPYDCCDEALAACLKRRPRCRVVERLAEDVCRMAQEGKEPDEIASALRRRALSMTPVAQPAQITLDPKMAAGSEDAPVTVVEYACPRCPFCAVLTPALHREVTEGELAGKVRLYFRPFPISTHPGSTDAALALTAAAEQGKFWPYAHALFERYDAFSTDLLPVLATSLDLDPVAFDSARAAEQTRASLVATKKEGIRNRVKATPTLFINGRLYSYELSLPVLRDVLTEEYERLTEKPPQR